MNRCLTCLLLILLLPAPAFAERAFPTRAKRILFLGDSITHASQYVAWIDMQLRLQTVDPLPEIISLGLASETCSGLSEPDHPFPRPDVHERLERALKATKPDVVVACYGMNDGIYYPFGEERFKAYQGGIQRLVDKVHAAGAKLVLLTPPPFDPQPLKGKGKLLGPGKEKYAYFAVYQDYDDVLARYAKWIMEGKHGAEMVIDVHTPLNAHLVEQRKKDPNYTMAPDGVHPNAAGHRMLGETILKAWGIESSAEPDPALLKAVNQRTKLLHDAWLSHVGHKRPGGRKGPPLEEAQQRAAELDEQIGKLVRAARQPASSQRRSSGGTVYHVRYPATARDGQLALSSEYFLWAPDTRAKLRGVIVHQHGCGPGASLGGRTAADDLHWQALARKWDCALMGSSYEPRRGVNCRLWCDARNGSDEKFLDALAHFAEAAKRDELNTAPWCLWGHSGGGFWASLMQVKHPQRIVAIWLRSGTAFSSWQSGEIPAPEISPAALDVPVMGNPGLKEKGHERFHRAWDGLTAMQQHYREQGAEFFRIAPDPRTGHECGDSRYLAIPFFDFWLKHRLGKPGEPLRPASVGHAAWDDEMSAKHEEYARTGAVGDTTPPPAPTNVRTQQTKAGLLVTWKVEADLESGIGHFLIFRDGKQLAQVPEKPVGRFGRPLFQRMSYHDTPEAPLPKLEFLDQDPPEGAKYEVRTVNSVGLVSD